MRAHPPGYSHSLPGMGTHRNVRHKESQSGTLRFALFLVKYQVAAAPAMVSSKAALINCHQDNVQGRERIERVCVEREGEHRETMNDIVIRRDVFHK